MVVAHIVIQYTNTRFLEGSASRTAAGGEGQGRPSYKIFIFKPLKCRVVAHIVIPYTNTTFLEGSVSRTAAGGEGHLCPPPPPAVF